jgi:hypothetical protein
MAGADAMRIRPETSNHREIGQNLIGFAGMSTDTGSYEIHSEPRGPHWIAWVTRAGGQKPDRSIVLVAETQEKAEARARQFAEQLSY